MGKYEELSKEILESVGGTENISYSTHCMTRLRLNLKDQSVADKEKIGKIKGVVGVMFSGGQLQIIIGQHVDKVYKEFCQVAGISNDTPALDTPETKKEKLTWKSVGSGILNGLAGSLTPLIPIIMAASMFKMLVQLLGPDMIGIMPEDSDLYTLFTFVGDAGFYFLPVFLGYTAAKKFGTSPVLGMFLGGILIHPTLLQMVTDGSSFSVFGIPTSLNDYSSTVLPAIISVWIMSYIEKGVKKIVPSAIRSVFVPTLTVLIMLPIMLVVIAPAGSFLGTYICNFLLNLYNFVGPVGVAIIGGLYMFLVISGMHLVLITQLILVISTLGSESLVSPGALAASFAVAGVALGSAIIAKKKENRTLSIGYFIAVFIGGVTEPTLYGVAIRYKKPLIALIIGGFVGGLYGGITGITAYSLIPVSSILNLLSYTGGSVANMVNAIITAAISLVVAAIATVILGYKED